MSRPSRSREPGAGAASPSRSRGASRARSTSRRWSTPARRAGAQIEDDAETPSSATMRRRATHRRSPRRGRGRARGDAGVPRGDAGARPALVRAAPAARLRLRRLSRMGAPRRHVARRLHVDAAGRQRTRASSTTPTTSTTRRCSPSRARRACRRRRSCRRRPTPAPTTATGSSRCTASCRSPATRRSARRSPWPTRAARRRRRYVQQTHAGLQPVDVALDGVHARASMLQDAGGLRRRARSGARPRRRRAGRRPTRTRRWPPQVVSTGVPHVVTPVRDAAALARARADAALLPALLDDAGRDLRLPRRGRLAGRRRRARGASSSATPGRSRTRRPAPRSGRCSRTSPSAPASATLTVGQGVRDRTAQHAARRGRGRPRPGHRRRRDRRRGHVSCSRTSVQRTPIRLSPGAGLPITVIGQAASSPLGIGGDASSGLGGPAPRPRAPSVTSRGRPQSSEGPLEERRRRRARGERVERRAGLRRQAFEAQRVDVALLLAHHARPAADAQESVGIANSSSSSAVSGRLALHPHATRAEVDRLRGDRRAHPALEGALDRQRHAREPAVAPTDPGAAASHPGGRGHAMSRTARWRQCQPPPIVDQGGTPPPTPRSCARGSTG